MDGDRPGAVPLEAFMPSELAAAVITPGREREFAADVDAWLRSLNLDRWEGDARFDEYLDDQLGQFLTRELATECLTDHHLDAVGEALFAIAEAGMEARYTLEVLQGRREDMRDSGQGQDGLAQDQGMGGADDGRGIDETAPARDRHETADQTISAHVQDVLRGIMEFVRGRDAHEHTRDHAR
jgi:hypothetical protein